MKKMHRETRGTNKPNEPRANIGAKERGMITDGASLEKGYKVVTPTGHSPEAVPLNK